ncbi:hypothetical protein M0804_015588 [Polistes exclamans]|nr:hypothetical protein M0804_015588 [Polistes exclamans]
MRIRRAVPSLQRNVAIRVCCAYKTVSLHATMMIAGIIPFDHLEVQVPPAAKAVPRANARRRTIASWKEEELALAGMSNETGVRVRAAVADKLKEWVGRPFFISTNFYTTQLMTGYCSASPRT